MAAAAVMPPPAFGGGDYSGILNISRRELEAARAQHMVVSGPPAGNPNQHRQGRPPVSGGANNRNGNRRRRQRRAHGAASREDDSVDPAEEEAEDAAQQFPELIQQTKICRDETIVRLTSYLGPYQTDPTKCWLCQAMMLNSPQLSLRNWNRMIELYREGLLGGDAANAINLYRFFIRNIFEPANKHLKPGQEPVPHIKAIDIYMHCHEHIKEASNQHWYEIQDLVHLQRGLKRAMWKLVRTVDGEVISIPRKKYIQPYLAVIAATRTHRRCDPTTMLGYNAQYSVTLASANPFANQKRPWEVENMPDAMDKLTGTGIGIKKARA